MVESLEIRSLTKIEDLDDVRRLEAKIWGELDSIPSHQTLTAVKNGGLVLGAYWDNRLVGFQYSFAGFNGKSVYLCSHILGTDPEFRNQGIGEKLKLAQAEEAKKLGYSRVTWTYDPLESINGYLNISKLGGVCSTYIDNCYGEMDDLLNSGLPSDRFLVEWHIGELAEETQPSKANEIQSALSRSLIKWELDHNGLPLPKEVLYDPAHDENFVYVPIPSDYRAIRETNAQSAWNWRMKTRELFTNLFQSGWQVSRFLKNPDKKSAVHFYVLSKKEVLVDENK